jgi:hypothetical protein
MGAFASVGKGLGGVVGSLGKIGMGLLGGMMGQGLGGIMGGMPGMRQPEVSAGAMQGTASPQAGTTPAPMAPGTPIESPQEAIDAATKSLVPAGGVRNVSDLISERQRAIPVPEMLGLPYGMTPEQERTYIATRATSGQEGIYRSPEALEYMKSLGLRGVLDEQGSTVGEVFPVERQMLHRLTGKYPTDALDYLFSLGEYLGRVK